MNIPIYDGCPIWDPKAVPFGFYNDQVEFQTDAVKVAKFCAARLGYPLVDVELQSGSFFTAFEEAITIYGNELYAYTIRDNQLSLEGATTGSNLNQALITPSFEPIVRLTEQYGAEAGSGGNVPYYSGSFELTSSIQDYSFTQFLSGSSLTGSEYNLGLEVKRVFYQEPVPASARLLSPYGGFGFGGAMAAGITGLGGFGGGMGFLMMPLNYDMQVIQSIEMNEMVRRNNYSFEIRNDKLRLFPIPGAYGATGLSSDLIIGDSLPLTSVTTTSATLEASLPLLAVSGSGANGIVKSDGINITEVEVSSIGSGYTVGDVITISQADLLTAGFTDASQDIVITLALSNISQVATAGRVWFEYILRNERVETSIQQMPTQVTNVSNTPYTNPNYDYINSVGRQWIFEYALALSKEMLGYVRGKYSSIPIPNAEVNLNQGDLLSAATAEKSALIERLRAYFDETSRSSLLARRAEEAESKMVELQQVPYTIYIA
tara:strand:- start:9381 stop:10850 length:1470 start_codon:yes stop_codon:yes gene_type:complete